VHNYSGETPLSNSQAQVKVYQGNDLVGDFAVPGGDGRIWTVFEMRDGVITPINTISDTAPSSSAYPKKKLLTAP